MSVRRLDNIPGFSIDRVARAAGDDPEVLRLENLDTDLPPPRFAQAATRIAIGRDDDNSYLPFVGQTTLREAVARHLTRISGEAYTTEQVVVTAGGPEIPQALVDQLAVGGRLVIPLAGAEGQRLVVAARTRAGVRHEDHGPASFVPLIGRFGYEDGPTP